MNNLSIKEKMMFTLAVVCMSGGMILLFLGFYAPPRGHIDQSVLYCFAEISLFAGSMFGISLKTRAVEPPALK